MSGEASRTPPTLAAAVLVRRIRRVLGGPRRLWRRSLRVRAVVVTLLLSSIAMIAVGTVMSYSIAQGLFSDRVTQVLAESARATDAAQKVVVATPATDPSALVARFSAIDAVQAAARPSILVWTGGGGQSGVALPTLSTVDGSPTLSAVDGVETLIKPDLRSALAASNPTQHWQSIAIVSGGQQHPAIIVGDTITIAGGVSDLYLIYDIQDVQDTLTVVQHTLLLGGLALLVLIAAVTAVVASLVVAPIKQAAAVSEQLAAGDLERRIPERGDDVVATLARSFNRMADSLQRQITQLANLSRVQQRFVSDVSHELRTPLTTIRLASDVLYDNRDRYDAPTGRSAELLRTQVERFESLLADLLEISRIDAQAADVTGEPTSLVDVAREVIDSLGGLAAEMQTEVRLVAPGGHVLIDVDARRIARIVRNLVANAIEHGEGRGVVITIDSSERALALGVRDHGIGLSEAHATRVFDRFWRADPSRQRRIGGTGLGLAISREDAVLHGGALEVWSRLDDGTNFVLTLPRTPGVEMDRPVPLQPDDAAPVTRPAKRPSKRAVLR